MCFWIYVETCLDVGNWFSIEGSFKYKHKLCLSLQFFFLNIVNCNTYTLNEVHVEATKRQIFFVFSTTNLVIILDWL